MEYKCPGCGNIISKESDATDCHSCGESLVEFWEKIDAEEQNKAAETAKNNILSEMQECIDNLEKGFQELMTVKLNSANKIYYNKIATENSPAQFSEYADKDEYKSVYKKLSSKYETFTTLLNQKIKSGKTVKFAITAAAVVVVLIAGISVLSIMTRKDTNVIVKGGDQNLNVNVNNNAGSNATSSTDVNSQNNQNGGTSVNINNDIKVDANGNRSKYQSYVFESYDHCINYFLKATTWEEKVQCCNYPDSAMVLLKSIKASMGDNFFKYNKVTKKEDGENGIKYYTITGGGNPPLRLRISNEDNGYRIGLWSSLLYGCESSSFDLDKSTKPVRYDAWWGLSTSNYWGMARGSYAKNNDLIADKEHFGNWKGKYNSENAYMISQWNYFWPKNTELKTWFVKKDSKVGKKLYEILKDGKGHRISLGVAWDNDDWYEEVGHDDDYDGYKIKRGQYRQGPSTKIITDVYEGIDFTFVEYDETLTELEQNYVPAPKL